MSLPAHQVRRATINDLGALRAMWNEERFAMGEMERRFTEFQVVETSEGRVVGALALQIQGNQGYIHSEAIGMPEHTEALREVLWDRLKKVATNHGLVRLWTGGTRNQWSGRDFRSPTAEELTRLPAAFGESEDWQVLQLKEESVQAISLEHELAMFREAQKAESEQFRQQAQKIRLVATVIAFLCCGLVFIGGFYYFQYMRNPDKYKNQQIAPLEEGSGVPVSPVSNTATTNLAPAPLPPPPATNQAGPDPKSRN